MAADHQAPDAQSDDLFGRWLAHHEQQSGDGDTTGQDVTDHNPPPRPSRRLPAAAVASSAVESDPMIGTRLQPPSSFGARRPDPNAQARPGSANEPQPAKGWEPIVIASARKKTEKPETRSTPKPPEQPSRFQRLKARFVDPKESTPETEATTEPDPPVAARAPLPTRTPTPLVTRSIEETIRAAVPEHQGARHVDVPVERPPAEQPQAPAATVVETVEPVARNTEPEGIAPPTPVRAFIDVTPLIDQHEPEPVPEERGRKHAALRAPEPEPALAPLVDDEPVVAESVVAEAEPELTIEPVIEPVIESVVESTLAVEPERAPVAFVEPQPEPEPEPVAVVEPQPEPEPQPSAVVEHQPEPIAVVKPQPEPSAVVEPQPEPIAVVEPQPEPEPEPVVAIEPEPELVAPPVTEEPLPAPAARRSFLSRGLREPKQPKQPKQSKQPKVRPGAPRPGTGDAARDLVAAKARARAIEPAPQPEPELEEAGAVAVEAPPEPEVAPKPRKVSKHDQVATEMPGVYQFKSKKTSRRLLTIALLIGLVVSAYFVKAAVDTKETASMGLAAIVLMATAMVWAIRAGAAPTRLEVHQGQLEVKRQGERYVFDLASSYTRIEVRGRPGRHGWKVLFPRRGMSPFAVDATMVDPDDFMRVLRFFRPDLVTH